MAWRCDRCGKVHTQNPKECRDCGNTTFEPVGSAELEDQSIGVRNPEPMDADDIGTFGRAAETQGDTSPDINPDGSLKTEETTSKPSEETLKDKGTLATSFYYKLRALFIAPFKLLWSYIIPILAFALVFGFIIWIAL